MKIDDIFFRGIPYVFRRIEVVNQFPDIFGT